MLATTIDTRKNYMSSITHAIIETRQYPQLRVIIARESILPAGLPDFRNLANRTHRPVISITRISKKRISLRPGNEICVRMENRYLTAYVFGLNVDSARELLLIGCSEQSSIPEAVRLAEMIVAKL